ncbi:MAG: DinB family protein [Chloroflexi bacterium]|nr:DinB family protein [Chloroflexota bacterium]
MLDFTAVHSEEITYAELVADLTRDDLIHLTNEMIDAILGLIADCTDTDVVFVPNDPNANDPYAENPDDLNLAWTLGHVIVHTTSSSEESAALAAELARGAEFHGRSRYETPWQTVTTMAQCRQRLEESRRMRLASLEMWPDEPHLDNVYEPWEGAPKVNAIGRFVFGLSHADSHLGQIAEVVRQTQAARA